MRARIAVLSHDSLRGRDTPSAGLESAAAYIARELAAMGWEPAGDSGTFLQRYPMPGSARGGARPPNVVAVLRGSDPALRETYVVLSAHMDHVGAGQPDAAGDSIYNGADDDASGTAAILEVAQAFAIMRPRPARSLLFLAVSGEEKGLLGSRHFTEHPPVPMPSMIANLNVDMIGRNAPDSIVVVGQEYSSLGATLREVGARHGELRLTVASDLWPGERFFFRSDQLNFARKEVPAVFFFAGTHHDYHLPSDEVELIDADKASRVARLIFFTAAAVAASIDRPTWDPDRLAEVRRLAR